ncbi:hypothetical protein KR200_010921 [Drosophila serrata]|nr:hypothetical protein KR200_010921 [Drosophila serrata]
MVQNSTATNSTLIDVSKLERQALGERRRPEDAHNLNTLLQDILCFFILLSLGLLIVASIFCVALNIHHTATHQHGHREKSENMSRLMDGDGHTKQDRLSFQRGSIWIRFFRCQKQPQQQPELEQLRQPEPDLVQSEKQPMKLKEQDKPQPHFARTYEPIDYSEMAEAEATAKESDSEPQQILVDNI